jgi:hypothetical protein
MKQPYIRSRKHLCISILSLLLPILVSTACAGFNPQQPKSDSNSVPTSVDFQTALPPSTPLVYPNDQGSYNQSSFVGKQGTALMFQGQPLKLYGYTFYPAPIGGSSAWHTLEFTHYIDHIMDLGAQAGQNLLRPTDFWDVHYKDSQQDDINIWKNMDYLVCAARQRNMFVAMDISAFGHYLVSQRHDPFDAKNWKSFLDAIGKHYINQTSIAFYSILGEPQPPGSVEAMNRLVDFYSRVTTELHKADGNHHLITAGGFNHMEDETAQTPWWQKIYALPGNDIMAFKTYSQNDLQLIPHISAFSKEIQKPFVDEEFGLPQGMGDAIYTGEVYNSIRTNRAEFFDAVYSIGAAEGVAGFVFWNMGCQLGDQSYQVSPLTPAVWKVIKEHAPAKPTTPDVAKSLC